MRRTVYMVTSPMTQWSPIVSPLLRRHWLAEMMSGSALQEVLQSVAPSAGRPQLVQPAQSSAGSPQSRQASQKGVPSKLQNMPGGHSPSSQDAPMCEPWLPEGEDPHWLVQSSAPAGGSPQLPQPVGPSQSEQASHRPWFPPSKLQKEPVGHAL